MSRNKMKHRDKRSVRLRRVKKRLHTLWREIVYARDEYRCVVCCKTKDHVVLNPHHWINYDGSCLESRYLPDNGVTLCAPDHLWKLHQQADAETIDLMRNYMFTKITLQRYEEIKAMKHKTPVPFSLEDYEELEEKLKEGL